MNITILGTGQVGATLGKALAAVDHAIMYGSRTPQAARVQTLLADTHPTAQAAGLQTAIDWADLVIIALAADAALTVVPTLNLAGKVVIDATNNIGWENGPVMGVDTSMGELLSASQPDAWWVKCFNTFGIEHVSDPQFSGAKADMLLCGDSAEAKVAASNLCRQLGFNPIHVGGMRYARQLEHLCVLWIQLATQGGLGRDFAFKLVGK